MAEVLIRNVLFSLCVHKVSTNALYAYVVTQKNDISKYFIKKKDNGTLIESCQSK